MGASTKIYVKGKLTEITGDNESGTVMVPLRAFAEALGHKVTWQAPDQVWVDGEPPAQPKPDIDGLPLAGEFFVIDMGHGGTDPGAVDGVEPVEKDSLDTKEAQLNFLYGVKLASSLKSLGAEVALTRTVQDQYLSPSQRAAIANDRYPHATAFISWHKNSATNKTAKGFEVLYYSTTSNGYRLAKAIVAQVKATGVGLHGSGLVARRDLTVLASTKMPAILIEAGFISNAQEEINLHDQGYMERLILAVTRGIVEVYGKKLAPQIDYRKFRHKGTDVHLAVVKKPKLKMAAAEPGKLINLETVAKSFGVQLAVNGGYFWYREKDKTYWPVTFVVDDHKSVGKDTSNLAPRAALCQKENGAMEIKKAKTIEELNGYKSVMGAGPMLVVNGKRQVGHDEKFFSDIMNGANPRTAVGLIDENTLVVAVVEGRTLTDAGLTLDDLADLLVGLGCKVAMNFDGGWSCGLYLSGKMILKGRAITNALLVELEGERDVKCLI